MGVQYLAKNQLIEHDWSLGNWERVIKDHPDLFEVVNDFSGYRCSVQDFQNYVNSSQFRRPIDLKPNSLMANILNSIDKKLAQLEDIQFMNYLDELNPSQSEPFIFHRIWRNLNEKDWTTAFNLNDQMGST